MKLFVLDHGKIVMEGENPVIQGEQAQAEKPAIPVYTALIQTEAGNILFDTACHPDAMDGAWPPELCGNPYIPGPEGGLLNRLAQIGVKPEEVGTVVLSHLHLDHAGGVHFFPQAKVYVQQEELDRVMADAVAGTLDMFHQPCDVANWKRAMTRWAPVPANVRETPLCPGVTILNLGPGHSFGMLALAVELAGGTVVLASDAVYAAVHYGPPVQLSGAVYDQAGYFAAIEYLRQYVADHSARLLYGHDMAQFRTLRLAPDGCYE